MPFNKRKARPVRILAAHRFFWPDTPAYASILRRITEHWASEGYEVDVFSTQPSYSPGSGIRKRASTERLNGVKVHRTSLLVEGGASSIARKVNVVLFPLKLALFLLRSRRYDMVMVSTFPPITMGFISAIAARLRGARLVYHCMDIHPEAGRLAGEFGNQITFRALRAMDSMTCRRASRVVVLSHDMRASLLGRCAGLSAERVDVRSNFVLPTYDEDRQDIAAAPSAERETRSSGTHLRLVFAGNIGRFQGLDVLLDALELTKSAHVHKLELVFVGDGNARPALERRARQITGSRVEFVGQQSVATAADWVRSADLCVVSLMPGVYRYAYPTKTMTYLHEGRPLLAIVEQDSELAKLVTHEGIGITIAPGDAQSLRQSLQELIESPHRLTQMKRDCERVYSRDFDESRAMAYWSCLARECAGGPG